MCLFMCGSNWLAERMPRLCKIFHLQILCLLLSSEASLQVTVSVYLSVYFCSFSHSLFLTLSPSFCYSSSYSLSFNVWRNEYPYSNLLNKLKLRNTRRNQSSFYSEIVFWKFISMTKTKRGLTLRGSFSNHVGHSLNPNLK